MPDKFRRACRGYNLIRSARDFIRELAGYENRRLGNPEIRRPFLGFIYTVHQRSIFLGRKVGVESGAKFRIHVTTIGALNQKLPFSHHPLAIEPNIEIATNTVDVRFRSPICAGVLSIRMTEGDVYPGKLFVL